MTDLLLEWLSYRGEGKPDDLPQHLLDDRRPRWVLDEQSALGHIEVPEPNRWCIAPPVLAGLSTHPGGEHQALLCGARTQGVTAALAAAAEDVGGHVVRLLQPPAPDVIRVITPTASALGDLAHRTQLPLQHNAALALLACLPSIREWPRTPCAMVQGRVNAVLRFSRSRLRWVPSTLQEAMGHRGFFSISRSWDRVFILKATPSECARIEPRAGQIAAVPKMRALEWDGATRSLGFPARLQPPMLIARALTLCSGTAPTIEGGYLRFREIPPDVLRLTLGITRLRIQ